MTKTATETADTTTILDRIAESFVPEPLQAQFYRHMRRLQHLDPNDEMLWIIEGIGFFTYITREAPVEMAAEREKLTALASAHVGRIEQAVQATAGYHEKLESRLVNLPEEVAKGLQPNVIASRIGENLRQRFHETELPQTAQMMKATAAHMAASSAELSAALQSFADPRNGAVSRLRHAVTSMNGELAGAATYVQEQAAALRKEVRETVFVFCGIALFLGMVLGMLLQARIHSCP